MTLWIPTSFVNTSLELYRSLCAQTIFLEHPWKLTCSSPPFQNRWFLGFRPFKSSRVKHVFFFLMHESRLSKKRDPSSSPKPGEDHGASLTCRGFSCFPAQGHLTVKAPSESDISAGFPDGDVMCFFPQTKSSGRNSLFSGNITHFFLVWYVFSLNDEKCGFFQLALLLSSMSLHSHWDWKCLIEMHWHVDVFITLVTIPSKTTPARNKGLTRPYEDDYAGY